MEKEVTKVYRHELKFLLSKIEYENLRYLLNAVMNKDINMRKKDDYYIRSLYFDSVTNTDYHEKVIGTSKRKKVRLRVYDVCTDYVKLEVKNKEKDYSLKETIVLEREDTIKLIKKDYIPLLKYDNNIAKKVYHILKLNLYIPKVLVDYEREAYFLPVENIRLTFDKNVRTSKNVDLFNKDLVMYPVLPKDTVILEVKYDKHLPKYISDILASVCMQRMSISKYCLSRQIVG